MKDHHYENEMFASVSLLVNLLPQLSETELSLVDNSTF